MTASILSGQTNWSMIRDENGHRTYTITHKVRAGTLDGPFIVMRTPGLPLIGSLWIFDNDLDPWAFCWPDMRVTPVVRNEPNQDWLVEQTFSTKPLSRCQDTSIEDPLLEPQKISGSFVKYTLSSTNGILLDKDGNVIKNASHEPIPDLERDANRPTVNISQNVSSLGLSTITQMVDTLNDAPLWGLAARKIKLSQLSWDRKLYGACNFYYTRNFGFDVNFGGFDETIPQVGTKIYDADNFGGARDNPKNFKIAKDDDEEILGQVYLTDDGDLAQTEAAIGSQTIQFYGESNFLILGIPTTIGL